MLETLSLQVARKQPLTDEEVRLAVAQLIDETVAAEAKADFLCQLALKGETVEEIAGFARALREKSTAVALDPETRAREILDVVGTGGDQLGTFNISTTVALLCAASGVTVAKHGNRAATSRCGSADVLEALGVTINHSPESAARALREHGFAFFFAPNFHPAFRNVAVARKLCANRGQRTIFNILGPLLNPALPSAQLVGVPRLELCEPMAKVLQSLGVRRAMVVCGSASKSGNQPAYLDELSTIGQNHIAEFYQARALAVSTTSADDFPLQKATLEDLCGGDCKANADLVRRLLAGDERGPKRDAVLLNAAAALFVAGSASSMTQGWSLAEQVVDSGDALRKLKELQGASKSV